MIAATKVVGGAVYEVHRLSNAAWNSPVLAFTNASGLDAVCWKTWSKEPGTPDTLPWYFLQRQVQFNFTSAVSIAF